jgi:hypothetical protein
MPKYILLLLLLNIIDTDVIIAQNLNDTLGVTIKFVQNNLKIVLVLR